MSDDYVWGSNVAGSWGNPANWNGTTTGQSPAAAAPGSTDNVTISAAAGGATNVVTGTGDSASLTIGGAAALQGQFTAGAYSAANFTLGSDGHGGTTVVQQPNAAAPLLAASQHSLHA